MLVAVDLSSFSRPNCIKLVARNVYMCDYTLYPLYYKAWSFQLCIREIISPKIMFFLQVVTCS